MAHPLTDCAATTAATAEPAAPRLLPSGRSVVVRVDGDGESLEVRTPGGEVEVLITLTAAGPLVRLSGARLELESPDSVSVRCRSFEVRAAEVTVRAEADLRLDGGMIRLNSPDGP